jgi:hypothetical protein
MPIVRCRSLLPAAVTMIAMLTSVGTAQSGSISGRVVDSGGGLLPGVAVTILPEAGGPPRSTTTAPDGTYRFQDLPDGGYRADFDLRGFDLIRLNHLHAGNTPPGIIDAILKVSAICECITPGELPPLAARTGRVVDTAGRPLPHARVEAVTSSYREAAYTDNEGQFVVRLPLDSTWQLTASDSGFGPMTRQVSGHDVEPIVLRLDFEGTAGVPPQERLDRGCGCGRLFVASP